MRQFEYVITDEVGIHARPAGNLAKLCKELGSEVRLEAKGKTAEAGKLMAVMSMGIKKGDTVTVTIEGGDEEQAVDKLEQFFKQNL